MRVFPEPSACEVLVCINASLVPILAGKIGELEQRYQWASTEDWEQGYQWAAEVQECLMSNCAGSSITELGALLAVALGLAEADTEQVAVAFPSIAAKLAEVRGGSAAGLLAKASDDPDATPYPSQITRLAEIIATTRNAQGNIPAGWFGWGSRYVTMADVYTALQGGGSDGNAIWDKLKDILDVGDDVLGLFGSGAGFLTETGLLSTLIALNTYHILVSEKISKRLGGNPPANFTTDDETNNIIRLLSGGAAGGDPVPDSILAALRGSSLPDKAASDTRNVIDALAAGAASPPELTQIQLLLEQLMSEIDVMGRQTLRELHQQLICVCENASKIARDTASIAVRKEVAPMRRDKEFGQAATPDRKCQRARWLVDALRKVLEALAYQALNMRTAIDDWDRYYGQYVGMPISGSANFIASLYNKGVDGVGSQFGDAVVAVLVDHEEEFVSAIYSAPSPAEANAAWRALADSLGAEALAAPTIVKYMTPNAIFNALFAGQIPLDPSELNNFSGTCSEGGNSNNPTPPGGWDYSEEYSVPDPQGNPSRIHPDGWQVVLLNKLSLGFPTEHDLEGEDYWTISTNLRGWQVRDSHFHATGFAIQIIEGNVLSWTVEHGEEYIFPADTHHVRFRCLTDDPRDCTISLTTPSQGSGWPW